jgi:hypothetical protein
MLEAVKSNDCKVKSPGGCQDSLYSVCTSLDLVLAGAVSVVLDGAGPACCCTISAAVGTNTNGSVSIISKDVALVVRVRKCGSELSMPWSSLP